MEPGPTEGDPGADQPERGTGELAYRTACRSCKRDIFMAICSDGRWRTFEVEDVPAAPEHVWAWRKHEGMQEQDLKPGKHLHFCAEYHGFGRAFKDI